MDLVIPLSKNGGPLFRQIYAGLRRSILAGMLRSGDRLPSTRDLANQLRVSRTVVLLAYDQLLAEGFISGRHGSGTYVSEGLNLRSSDEKGPAPTLHISRFGQGATELASGMPYFIRRPRSLRYDFAYGKSNIEHFPFETWRRILLRNTRKTTARHLDYGSAAGIPELQEAICRHIRRARAVVCDPSQVIVTSGSQQALDLIVRVLFERGNRVVLEDPHYLGARHVLSMAGIRLHAVPVDRNGMITGKLPDNARAAFVTPSHQFPTGVVLTLPRRLELLAWAKRHNAVIIEDDYDGEFRYGGQPLESLQGLDPEGRVIYIGTFSRTIFPALRIGYLIAPRQLVPAFTAAKWLCDRQTAPLEQRTLAEFITSGAYERCLHRVRRSNTTRRNTLLDAVRKYIGDRAEFTGDGAGAHIVLWPRDRISEEGIIQQAAARDVSVYGVAPYFLKRSTRPGLLIGYSRMRETDIREGIRRLSEVI